MPSLYFDPLHPLLSPAALALGTSNPDALDAQAMVAERLLGLAGTDLTDDEDLENAALADALQVNWQLANPIDEANIQSETRGSRSVTYRSGGVATALVNPAALEIVDGLFPRSSNWAGFGPRR